MRSDTGRRKADKWDLYFQRIITPYQRQNESLMHKWGKKRIEKEIVRDDASLIVLTSPFIQPVSLTRRRHKNKPNGNEDSMIAAATCGRILIT